MKAVLFSTAIFLTLCCLGDAMDDPLLRIGAWNLKRFGKAKMEDKRKVDFIVKVLIRYDVIVIMEVVDKSETAIKELQKRLNSEIDEGQYLLKMSPRLGRIHYKEQYAFLYRGDKMEVGNTFLYSDPFDVFQFEPYTVLFTSSSGKFDNFAVTPLHSKPKDAEKEIDALVDVCGDLVHNHFVSDILLLGDFNAGCTYVTENEWENVRLAQQTEFHWMIDGRTDTTTAYSNCPYDRIVLYGEKMLNRALPNSAQVYYFDKHMDISLDEAEDISDHYPVEIQLLTNRGKEIEDMSVEKSIAVTSTVSPNALDNLRLAAENKECSIEVTNTAGITGTWTVSSPEQVTSSLDCIAKIETTIFTDIQIETLAFWLKKETATNDAVLSVQCASSTYICTTRVAYTTSVINGQ